MPCPNSACVPGTALATVDVMDVACLDNSSPKLLHKTPATLSQMQCVKHCVKDLPCGASGAGTLFHKLQEKYKAEGLPDSC